jgi:hypothetical protein
MLEKSLSERQLLIIELLIIAFFCFAPLLFNNPYRINIFLSWEGAYRMYLGQVPFRDFSLPMGYGYWVIPALFFKIFGPYFYSLIKAQVLINLISALAFRSILKTLNVSPVIILLSVLVYCFSYVSFNFWPWYNNTVIAFELVAIYFTLKAIFSAGGWKMWAKLMLAAFFIFFAIWTKHDAGGLGLLIIYGILSYDAWMERSSKRWLAFTGFFLFFTLLFIVPLLQYDLTYWFNYGQAPHRSRLVVMNFLNEILGWAYWEKFFLLLIILFVLDKVRTNRAFFDNKKEVLFAFICIAIIMQAWVIPVTSPVPEKNEVFFYAFGFAYMFSYLRLSIDLTRWYYLAVCLFFVAFWWTGIYWRNIQRVISKKPNVVQNVEQRNHKYRLAKEYKTMERLFLAESTLDGIRKIKELDIVENRKDLKVLNMSELTSLAYEIPFTPPVNQPMWYHQTVSIFQDQVDEFCEKIRRKEYDLVIFETVSEKEAINFFPMDVKKCLMEHYRHEFTFLAPRHPEDSYVDVFTKPD